jgi:NADH-quinone oxidoreductase subunit F
MSTNLSLLSARKEWSPALFEKLSGAVSEDHELQKEHLREVAKEYLMGEANTLGTLSFYDHFKPEHLNKKIFLCNGTACMVAGTQERLKKAFYSYFEDHEIGEMCCLGRCHENAAFHYQGKNYSGQPQQVIKDIIDNKNQQLTDLYAVRSALRNPVLVERNNHFGFYKALFARIRGKDPSYILREIKDSGLRGRGGAGFFMADKLEACKARDIQPKFVVCNADEGDPGSYSDRYLLENQPHAVLFGMLVAAHVVGAHFAIVYIRAEYPESVSIMQDAVALWKNWFSEKNQEPSAPPIKFKIVKGAGSYICGEETALLSSLEGQRPEVRIRPPYPTEKGLFQKPTVVNNVETFANIPYIINVGAKDFRNLGTDKTPGTKLLSLDSYFNNPGIVEVEMGTPLYKVVYEMGGGFKLPVKALHIGGPLGGIVPISKISSLEVDFESFKSHGFDLGHASIVSIPEQFPMIKYLTHLFEFASHESCGKCFPCRLGTIRGQELLQQAEIRKIDSELFKDLLETLKLGSLCGLGRALPLPVENALTYFHEELKSYFHGK